MRRRLCPAVMSSSSILDMSGCYSSHPPDDCLGFIKLETMFKGIHIFCDGAIYCPVVTSIPVILQAACALAVFLYSNYLGHHRVKDKLKPPFLLQMTLKAGLMMILTIMDQQP
ncbi:putative exported protein [Yersinia enterocolitica subsp. enterocolitica 8081]|uniref:Exported protein n=1 Tax=Yersinia enterocolitica serotype O:8 / biotype 1B (strain NCTC 13174 / 8081) TaxID=393305 RepID=A1JKM5_YERE8|nr:putative exported protein [Yersinia enterocolitica subsp. enterocolitica 8081]